VPDWGLILLKRKAHRAFLFMGVVSPAELSKNQVNFASNHGTMPRKAVKLSRLKLSVLPG